MTGSECFTESWKLYNEVSSQLECIQIENLLYAWEMNKSHKVLETIHSKIMALFRVLFSSFVRMHA